MTDPAPEPTPAPTPSPEPDKVFTQADVDRIMGETRRKAKPADYDDLRAAAAELARLKEASASDLDKAVNTARRETEETIRAEVRRERVLDRIEVLAAKDFADAEDARLRLGTRADDFVGKDGQVDADAITAALKTLLEDKPHLAAAPDRRFKGGADGGPRIPVPPSNPKLADLHQIEADLNAARGR